MILREAMAQDLPVLLEFEQGVIASERPYDKTLADREIHYYDLNFLMTSENAMLVVAEENNEIIASGYALIKQPEKNIYDFTQYAYLGFMFVKPDHRGKGINQKIVDKLIDWAKSKNLSEIRLEVYDQNEPAVKAYEKAGFEPLILTMRLKV